ncbi:MAG: amidohydrolase [Anaerolineaceae bacterium]|nr:amidohydrolase [Anaerolineaceae bacterium]
MKTENLEKIIELRHRLHRHPELSGNETETIRILSTFLRENTSLEVISRNGWFYAVKNGNSGTSPIAFRADMDALPMNEGIDIPYASINPGTAHKCGHDGHSAALCGLALELDQMTVPNTVYLIFQPAEEIGQGGEICAELIDEKGISEIYAFHNRSGFPEKSVIFRRNLTQPASEGLLIRLEGKTSHASEPELGKNPAAALAELLLYSRDIIPGQQDGMTLCTPVGIQCGTDDFGISAGNGHISFTLRAEKEPVMFHMEKALLQRAADLAERDGLVISHKIIDRFPETANHDFAIDRVIKAASELGLQCIEMRDIWRGSEDFGYYLKKCPGAIFYIGNGEAYPPIHTRTYDFNDNILETAVDMFLTLACEV